MRSATDVVAPGQAARDYESANAARVIALDDGTNTNLLKGAATEAAYTYLANGSPARVGYHVSFAGPVVLEPRHGSFVFQPTLMVAGHPDRSPVTITGQRPSVPTVGGDTRVATFNVLNYFSDLGVDEAGCKGYPDRTGVFVTAKKCKVRGAFSREAFANQEAKIVSAINALGADVVALEEIENPVAVGVGTDRDASLARLVEALETAGWAHVSGAGEASYVYSGRSGSLDHVFANAAAKPLLAGVTSWAVNAQESIAFEYSRAGMNAHLAVEANNSYRSSDHNPELIGLTLSGGEDPAPAPPR